MQIRHFLDTRSVRQFLTIFLLACCSTGMAQKVMLQGWYWNYPAKIGIQRYAQNYLNYLPDFSSAGFDYIWLPPLSRSSTNQASVGYDVMDYYDLGEYGLGATRFGTRKDVQKLTDSLHARGIQPIADMVYNQRAGGAWEDNPAVQGWITNMNATKISNGDQPYPSDRFRCYIVLGGNSGVDTGNYYFKFRSASLSSNFYGFPYQVQMWTSKVPRALDSLYNSWEYEPNGGGECGDSDNFYILGYTKWAHIDAGGCGIDEFHLHLDTSMFNRAGDTLFITMGNSGATGLNQFSDHYLYDVWDAAANASIKTNVKYQTATDFTHMTSGKGPMNWSNFKPDGNPTQLSGDWDEMLFFYDVDQYVSSTRKVISDYQEFMFDSVGIQGMRVDAVKNYTYVFTAQMLDSLHAHGHNPEMVVGEFYDYNPSSLTGFIGNVTNNMSASAASAIHMKVFDFALRGALKSACDQFGYDVRNVFTAGMVDGASGNGINAVTWVNNHDFRDPGQPVTYNPELVYAYILTNQKIGTPCVYLGDYFGTNFMRGRIKGLMHASKRYITGFDQLDYLSAINSSYSNSFVSGLNTTTLIYQFHNPVTNREVITAINFAGDSLDVYQKVNTAHIGTGDSFTDIFGMDRPLVTTITANQEIHVKLPPRSFTVYVQGGDLQDSLISLGDTIAPVRPTTLTTVAKTDELISVFPNPFSQSFGLKLNDDVNGVMDISIYDLSGRKVYSESMTNPTSGVMLINPQLASSGIYVLRVNTGNDSHFFKLAKN